MRKRFFTSESVTEGHPDKMCDQISDSVLDAIMAEDPNGRVACECSITTGLVLVSGEISTNCYIDIQKIVRNTIDEIGFNDATYGFDAKTCGVLVALDEQSTDIAMGVDNDFEHKIGMDTDEFSTGAGDQGLMFGYADNETDTYMPMPIHLAHILAKKLTNLRRDGVLDYLRPDGKTQVTVEYHDNKPVRVDTIVVSTQHSPDVSIEKIKEDIIRELIETTVPLDMLDDKTKIYVNPTGRFVIGGPHGDAGLTGRKIIVDTYGGYARHGGGAFSGKDCTKVDRSAAYAARWVAKNIVAAGLADRCEIELAYAIGIARPLSILVETFGTGKLSENEIEEIIAKEFDLRPAAIIKALDLRKPIYKQTAAYGHFGRNDLDLPWERLNKVEDLKKYLK